MKFEFRKPKGAARSPMKICLKCRQEKDVYNDFQWVGGKESGWPVGKCKKCTYEHIKVYRSTRRSHYAMLARNWLKNNPTKAREMSRKAYLKDGPQRKKKYLATQKGFDKQIAYNEKRRAAELNAMVSGSELVTNEWFNELCEKQNNECSYCGKFMQRREKDHRIPLTRGGLHLRENITPSCRSCNATKHNRTIGEWRPSLLIPIYGLDLSSA